MTSVPIADSNENPSGSQSSPETDDEKQGRKLTVLESHGYILGKTIGAGSYATVKIARSDRHNCQVAIKIVSKFQAPGDCLTKFLPREIEVVKGLKHPNLIRFLQAIETTHRVYIIMEYAPNGSLLDVIRRDTYIDEARSRKWFRQLLEAIDYCHERGVVHRDVKCENLLMDINFNVKLSDFGFARGHMKTKNGAAPLSETFCGSYAYASPEILKGIPYQPQLSDVWSMGVVLYAMLFGRLPFNDSNYAQLLKQVQNKVHFPKIPKVSQACRSLINRILVSQRSRLRIPNIRSDSWLTASAVASQTSTIKSLNVISSAGKSSVEDNLPCSIKLLSKEEAAKRDENSNIPRAIGKKAVNADSNKIQD
ncbi:testis-specific serine/threonine-protein kinase 3-like [Prorops nasuta]|uniref:testis-specific serine/threonine-protein kinase 3-like n=1 Tax=Prorops nasuta TaxID=863751 RepID=UPI0034CD25C4